MTIKQRREQVGITQCDLAKRLGVDQSTVCLWETQKTRPRAALLPKLAAILGCSIDELMAEE